MGTDSKTPKGPLDNVMDAFSGAADLFKQGEYAEIVKQHPMLAVGFAVTGLGLLYFLYSMVPDFGFGLKGKAAAAGATGLGVAVAGYAANYYLDKNPELKKTLTESGVGKFLKDNLNIDIGGGPAPQNG